MISPEIICSLLTEIWGHYVQISHEEKFLSYALIGFDYKVMGLCARARVCVSFVEMIESRK